MVQYTLHYFNGRGAGEVSRQLFVLAGQPFEDKRYTHEEWPQHKDQMPFGQMPVLEVDGKKLPQSFAIARFLAKKFGFSGKSAWDEAVVDSLADQYKDLMNEIRPYLAVLFGFGQGDLEKLKADVFVPGIKKHFAFFTKFLRENGTGYLVGNSVSWVDLLVAEFVATLVEKEASLLSDFPELKAHSEKIHAIAELKTWRETRPVTPF